MTITALAHLYVYILEPAFKVALVVLAVLMVLQVINLFSGKDKKFPWVDSLMKTIFKAIFLLFTLLGRTALWIVKVLPKFISRLIDAVRDFFVSPI